MRGAAALARRLGISPLLIGLTLVGFGTSTPELVTSIQAALVGSPGVSIGNVVGSNIANILLILGATALMAPIAVSKDTFLRDSSVLVASALICLALVLYGALDRFFGAVLILGLLGYVVWCFRSDVSTATVGETGPAPSEESSRWDAAWFQVALVIAGLALTILGAKWLVGGAIGIAAALGVSETLIGLTVVAVGTSLPELVTAFTAARRGHSDIAYGNIVGSNIYNVLFILGTTAVVHPIPVPPEIARLDIWVMLAATVALIWAAVTGRRISRTEGGVLLASYVGYLFWLGCAAAG